jgi:hypothetical protein
MDSNVTLLWIGKRHASPAISGGVKGAGYRLITACDLTEGLSNLRKEQVSLVILENDVSCVQGELAAVRVKSAAPRIPILLLCDPLDSATPQAFFVNLILGLQANPELLLRAIATLVPQQTRKTAS